MEKIESNVRGNYLYIIKDFLFCLNKQVGDKYYMFCNDNPCDVRAVIDKTELIKMSSDHSHEPPKLEIEQLKMKAMMREKCMQTELKYRDIYNEAAKLYPAAASSLTYKSIESMLRRARATLVPPAVENIEDICTALSSDKWKRLGLTVGQPHIPFFQTYVRSKDAVDIALFASPNLALNLDQYDVYIDVTSKFIPSNSGIYLMLIFMFGTQNILFPAIFALMSKTSVLSYKDVLMSIKLHLGLLKHPNLIYVDYDWDLRQAILQIFPDSTLYGTWFHFCKVIYKEFIKLNLNVEYKNDAKAMSVLKMLMSLPFLPSEYMAEGFRHIDSFCISENLQCFQPLINYIKDEQAGLNSKMFSFLEITLQMRDMMEAYRRVLLKIIGHNSAIWGFIKKLREMEHFYTEEFNNIHNDGQQNSELLKASAQNRNIEIACQEFALRKINVTAFLNKAVCLNIEILRLVAMELEDDSYNYDDEDEEVQEDTAPKEDGNKDVEDEPHILSQLNDQVEGIVSSE